MSFMTYCQGKTQLVLGKSVKLNYSANNDMGIGWILLCRCLVKMSG
jgi:hypothetical protein